MHRRDDAVTCITCLFLSPSHPGLGPRKLPWVASGSPVAEAWRPWTPNLGQTWDPALPSCPIILKNDIGPTTESKQIRSRVSW